jgi:hypothetical protein
MRAFVGTAINNIAAKHPDVTAAILQFSNDVRVEVAPQSLDSGAFSEQLSDMVRDCQTHYVLPSVRTITIAVVKQTSAVVTMTSVGFVSMACLQCMA